MAKLKSNYKLTGIEVTISGKMQNILRDAEFDVTLSIMIDPITKRRAFVVRNSDRYDGFLFGFQID
jgi:hypothetical protein